MGRFHITQEGEQVEYCRVLFSNTKKSQIVKGELVKSGEFEDASLKTVTQIGGGDIHTATIKTPYITTSLESVNAVNNQMQADFVNLINNAPSMDVITDTKIDLSGAVTLSSELEAESFVNALEDSEPLVVKEEQELALENDSTPSKVLIATNPDGEDAEVEHSLIAEFCEYHSLDIEAVEACLAGTQKTHKKWRFVFA